jgi:hypothetical protein
MATETHGTNKLKVALAVLVIAAVIAGFYLLTGPEPAREARRGSEPGDVGSTTDHGLPSATSDADLKPDGVVRTDSGDATQGGASVKVDSSTGTPSVVPSPAAAAHNLAEFYASLSDCAKAELESLQAIKPRGNALGPEHLDPAKLTGPEKCKDCHESAFYAWKETHHHQTLTQLYTNKVEEMRVKLNIPSARGEQCRDCHFTPINEGGRTSIFKTFGTSCESCHGAALEWADKHGNKGQSRRQLQESFRKCDQLGMIRPANLYTLAANCFGCHIVADEKVVNIGGHPLGGDFELVARTQGEVRHNFSADPKQNAEAKPERKRLFFVVGRLLDLEYSLRAAAKATKEGKFATEAASRVNAALARLKEIQQKAELPELKDVLAAASLSEPKINNGPALVQSADVVAALTKCFARAQDGSKLGAVDTLLPAPGTYKGRPFQPR